MKKRGNIFCIQENCLIGFDAEWTKNYKIKNGNIPFCFSVVSIERQKINLDNLKEGKVEFRYLQYYCDSKEEIMELIFMAETCMDKILDVLSTSILCGHQISSDFAVLCNYGKVCDNPSIKSLEHMRTLWKDRKESPPINIVDTRYDINRSFLGKSRRLVDMSNDFNLDVTQPELGNKSMTLLQNQFYETGDDDICERISVMNLRHSLCAIVLYWLNENIKGENEKTYININKTVYNCLKEDFRWVNSKEFSKLIRR